MSKKAKKKISLLTGCSLPQILDIARKALELGPDFPLLGHLFDKRFDIISLKIEDNSLLIEYRPEFLNHSAIYVDICFMMSFLYNLLLYDLDIISIYNMGVQARSDGRPILYIISHINSIKAINEKDCIYWLKNSIIDDSFKHPSKVLFLAEGPTETNSYPLLFESMGYRTDAFGIDIFPFAERNIDTLLTILNHNNEKFYLACDKDKHSIIMDLKRRNLLRTI